MNPRVSVIIPTYNQKEKVKRAVESVLIQEPKNYEIVVVDDGSSDGTFEFLSALNLPIKLLRKENGGVSTARNLAIQSSVGEYVAFLDHDDLWLTGKLAAQVEFLNAHPEHGLVYTDEYIDADGVRDSETRFDKQPPRNGLVLPVFVDLTPIHTSAVMVRRGVLNDTGLFDPTLLVHQDSDLWNRISEKYSFGYIEKPLAVFNYDTHGGQTTTNRKLFLEDGRRYMAAYEARARARGITPEEQKAITESYRLIKKEEELTIL